MTNSRTRTVPSSPLARVFGFGQLAAGLAMGTVAEAVRQSVRGGDGQVGAGGAEGNERRSSVKQYVASDANAERLAETLCRMRGAALKLGQMLSIQVRRDVFTRDSSTKLWCAFHFKTRHTCSWYARTSTYVFFYFVTLARPLVMVHLLSLWRHLSPPRFLCRVLVVLCTWRPQSTS